MPWQRYVADVAGEIDSHSGQLAYREVIVTVPRQSGKTTLVLSQSVHRANAFRPPQRIVYAAQTRLDARKKWEDDHLAILARSPFGPPIGEWRIEPSGRRKDGKLYRVRKTTGAEAVLWRNGSQHAVVATTLKSGHGQTLDEAFVDEAFAQEDDRLEQAFKPTMITRESPQLWILSTAGDDRSRYLRSKVDAGRIVASEGIDSGIAYFDWSAPITADPADPATWLDCMPALCPNWPCQCDPEDIWHHTVSIEAVEADYISMSKEGKLAEFRRAYLNQWIDTIPDEWLVIPEESWRSLTADPIAHGDVAIAIDVTPKRSFSAIVAAWRRPDGHMDVEVIAHEPGTMWLPARLAALVKKHRPCGPEGTHVVVVDPAGPAGSLIDTIEAAGVQVQRVNAREVAHGSQRFFDMVMDSRTLRHNSDPALDAAVAGAIRRDLGDGWAWARKTSNADISPLVAATLAVWAHDKFAKREAPYDVLKSVA